MKLCTECGRTRSEEGITSIGTPCQCCPPHPHAIEVLTEADVYCPGAWECLKCGFVLQKNLLFFGSGTIGADTTVADHGCPNDGELMHKLTWRVMSEKNAERACREIASNTAIKEQLSAAKAETARLRATLRAVAAEPYSSHQWIGAVQEAVK